MYKFVCTVSAPKDCIAAGWIGVGRARVGEVSGLCGDGEETGETDPCGDVGSLSLLRISSIMNVDLGLLAGGVRTAVPWW